MGWGWRDLSIVLLLGNRIGEACVFMWPDYEAKKKERGVTKDQGRSYTDF